MHNYESWHSVTFYHWPTKGIYGGHQLPSTTQITIPLRHPSATCFPALLNVIVPKMFSIVNEISCNPSNHVQSSSFMQCYKSSIYYYNHNNYYYCSLVYFWCEFLELKKAFNSISTSFEISMIIPLWCLQHVRCKIEGCIAIWGIQ